MRAVIVLAVMTLLGLSPVYAADAIAHLTNINRAPLAQTTLGSFAGTGEFVSITNPVAVGVRGNLVYIVDGAKQIVYRYNRSNERLTPLYAVNNHVQGIPNAIAVAHDGSFYLSDPFARKILHFTVNGELRRSYSNNLNLTNPVAITLPGNGNILVADRLYDHVLVFNPAGQALYAIGQRGVAEGQFLEIVDMASGPEGIYVIDRMTKSIKIFSEQGKLLRQIARAEVNDPSAIAVDYAERIYISDAFDDTIKIYDRNGLLETVGGTGGRNGLFRIIRALHVDNNFLYVADSANDRVQVFLIKPVFSGDNRD